MLWKFLVIPTVILLTNLHVTFTHNCFTNDGSYKCQLGMKTPYRFIANHNDSQFSYPGCTEKKIWILIRHGTRYPSEKIVALAMKIIPKVQKEILYQHTMNRSQLSSDQVHRLSEWTSSFTENNTMDLAEEGERELVDLAERFQSRFPTLMPEIYQNRTYKFKFTATQRTNESARHFVLGLFGRQNSREVWYPEPEHEDSILRFYKRCPRWLEEVKRNPETRKEWNLFIGSSIVAETLDDISSRLGFEVDYETAHLMYVLCAFETAWKSDEESSWCAVLSPNNFKVIEFAEDLQFYWIHGYGFRLSYEQACPALMDVFNFFESDLDQLATVYFTHSGTVLKFLALLGLAKDEEPLTHSSFHVHRDERAWRLSRIDAFASNIAFILYDCKSEGAGILMMHQERIVQLPGCPKNIPCPIGTIQKIYPEKADECKFDSMCALRSGKTNSSSVNVVDSNITQ